MRLFVRAAAAAICLNLVHPAVAAECEVHFYPAPKLQSVGEDFDAVHKLDQDLREYDRNAGKPLEWLTPERQQQLLSTLDAGSLLGLHKATLAVQGTPLKRSEALGPGPHSSPAPACLVEVMVPQMLMERGGLSTRSLRLFGVVRTYQSGRQAKAYAGFAAQDLSGFRMKAPADAPSATRLVEHAFVEAVTRLLIQSNFHAKTN